MGLLHSRRSSPGTLSLPTGISKRVLRHLIVKHDFMVGSRVLDVGCGRGQLAGFLSELGFDVTGIDDAQSPVENIPFAAPQTDLFCGGVAELADSHQQSFDVVLVRGLAAYRADLFSSEAFRATADLISCVRPGKLLAFLVRTGSTEAQQPAAHSVACYENHLAAFTGRVETTGLPDSYMQPGTWKSFLSGRRPAGYVTTILQTPTSPPTRAGWLRLAESAASTHAKMCCCSLAPFRDDLTALSAA